MALIQDILFVASTKDLRFQVSEPKCTARIPKIISQSLDIAKKNRLDLQNLDYHKTLNDEGLEIVLLHDREAIASAECELGRLAVAPHQPLQGPRVWESCFMHCAVHIF